MLVYPFAADARRGNLISSKEFRLARKAPGGNRNRGVTPLAQNPYLDNEIDVWRSLDLVVRVTDRIWG